MKRNNNNKLYTFPDIIFSFLMLFVAFLIRFAADRIWMFNSIAGNTLSNNN